MKLFSINFESLKRSLLLVTSVVFVSSISSCKKSEEETKKDNNNEVILEQELENITKYKENDYIDEDEYKYYSSVDTYINKSEDEVASILSTGNDFDALNYVLSVAPSSLSDDDLILLDSLSEGRMLCRDFINKKFYDSVIISLSNYSDIDYYSLDIDETVINISEDLYINMNNYVKSYNVKDAEETIRSGINIKNDLKAMSAINICERKINAIDSSINYIYRGNNSELSNIKIIGDSSIKKYYDKYNDYINNISGVASGSICRDDYLYYLENYYNILREEYIIVTDDDNVYAIETSKAKSDKTLALH